ncbi:hypothetical protein TNCV_1295901 [Trichonephila clavipes]|uniref:Uncharacterized protein n=1 Tax=Trichonephila clavipes TaxID=2585209 RepID=A0A8X6VN47_TRICX|nr:hypothetical protein TNCV_1295901 [Trichonephila clavipes]
MCSLNDAVLPTGVIDFDETGHMDRRYVSDDVTKTVVANSTLFFLSLVFLLSHLVELDVEQSFVELTMTIPDLAPFSPNFHTLPTGGHHPRQVAAVAEWYRYRTVARFVTGSSPVPLKTR